MKVLALTGRRRLTAAAMRAHRKEMALGPGTVVELICVEPLAGDLPVRRVDAAEPSLVPFRPLVPVSGPGVRGWGGRRKLVTRMLRGGRRVVSRLPLPDSTRRTNQTYLAVAAATSPDLLARARAADVIVSLDAPAALAAWHLARRVEGPAVVHGAENVRMVLERMGRALPPRPQRDSEPDVDDAGSPAVGGTPLPDPASGGLERAHAVLIAPANYAGQGRAWAQAVRDRVPDIGALNLRIGAPNPAFPTDYFVRGEAYNGDLEWRLAWRDFVEEHFTHVVIEANVPILGGGLVGTGEHNARELLRAGKTVALLSHGSDARVPSIHAEREPWHSYDALTPAVRHRLETQSRANVEVYNAFEGTVFVSTPGVRAFVPRAVWLPVVVEPGRWATEGSVLAEGRRPVVAHVPSSAQKGSHMIDPVLSAMADRGVIDYLRVSGVPHEQMPEVIGSADIVIEQFGIADYSVASCEAMAAGRVVVSRVADDVRATVLEETGLELPIVEANPETLEKVVLDLVADPDRSREIGERGRAFVTAVHDGRRSAEVLQRWVGSTGGRR